MSDELLAQIKEKLEQLVRLSAVNAVKGLKQNQAIVVLGEAGLDRNLIADILGTTPGTVSVRLSQVKAASKPSAKKKEQPTPAAESPLSDETA